jgi:hypothetical protein
MIPINIVGAAYSSGQSINYFILRNLVCEVSTLRAGLNGNESKTPTNAVDEAEPNYNVRMCFSEKCV